MRAFESPKYRLAIRVAEALLRDHPEIQRRGETSYSVLLESMKTINVNYNMSDMTQLVSRNLYERCTRVWK